MHEFLGYVPVVDETATEESRYMEELIPTLARLDARIFIIVSGVSDKAKQQLMASAKNCCRTQLQKFYTKHLVRSLGLFQPIYKILISRDFVLSVSHENNEPSVPTVLEATTKKQSLQTGRHLLAAKANRCNTNITTNVEAIYDCYIDGLKMTTRTICMLEDASNCLKAVCGKWHVPMNDDRGLCRLKQGTAP